MFSSAKHPTRRMAHDSLECASYFFDHGLQRLKEPLCSSYPPSARTVTQSLYHAVDVGGRFGVVWEGYGGHKDERTAEAHEILT